MYTPPFRDMRFDQCLYGSAAHDMRSTRVKTGAGEDSSSAIGNPTVARLGSMSVIA